MEKKYSHSMEFTSQGERRFGESDGWRTLLHAQQTCLPQELTLSCNGVKGELLGGHAAPALMIYVACQCPSCHGRVSHLRSIPTTSIGMETVGDSSCGRPASVNSAGSSRKDGRRAQQQLPCSLPGPLFHLEDWYIHCHCQDDPSWRPPTDVRSQDKAEKLVKSSILVLQPEGRGGEGSFGGVQDVPLGDWIAAFCRRYHDVNSSLVGKYVQVLWWNDEVLGTSRSVDTESQLEYGNWYAGKILHVCSATGHLRVRFDDGELNDVALGVNFVHFGKQHPTGKQHAKLPPPLPKARPVQQVEAGAKSVSYKASSGSGGSTRQRRLRGKPLIVGGAGSVHAFSVSSGGGGSIQDSMAVSPRTTTTETYPHDNDAARLKLGRTQAVEQPLMMGMMAAAPTTRVTSQGFAPVPNQGCDSNHRVLPGSAGVLGLGKGLKLASPSMGGRRPLKRPKLAMTAACAAPSSPGKDCSLPADGAARAEASGGAKAVGLPSVQLERATANMTNEAQRRCRPPQMTLSDSMTELHGIDPGTAAASGPTMNTTAVGQHPGLANALGIADQLQPGQARTRKSALESRWGGPATAWASACTPEQYPPQPAASGLQAQDVGKHQEHQEHSKLSRLPTAALQGDGIQPPSMDSANKRRRLEVNHGGYRVAVGRGAAGASLRGIPPRDPADNPCTVGAMGAPEAAPKKQPLRRPRSSTNLPLEPSSQASEPVCVSYRSTGGPESGNAKERIAEARPGGIQPGMVEVAGAVAPGGCTAAPPGDRGSGGGSHIAGCVDQCSDDHLRMDGGSGLAGMCDARGNTSGRQDRHSNGGHEHPLSNSKAFVRAAAATAGRRLKDFAVEAGLTAEEANLDTRDAGVAEKAEIFAFIASDVIPLREESARAAVPGAGGPQSGGFCNVNSDAAAAAADHTDGCSVFRSRGVVAVEADMPATLTKHQEQGPALRLALDTFPDQRTCTQEGAVSHHRTAPQSLQPLLPGPSAGDKVVSGVAAATRPQQSPLLLVEQQQQQEFSHATPSQGIQPFILQQQPEVAPAADLSEPHAAADPLAPPAVQTRSEAYPAHQPELMSQQGAVLVHDATCAVGPLQPQPALQCPQPSAECCTSSGVAKELQMESDGLCAYAGSASAPHHVAGVPRETDDPGRPCRGGPVRVNHPLSVGGPPELGEPAPGLRRVPTDAGRTAPARVTGATVLVAAAAVSADKCGARDGASICTDNCPSVPGADLKPGSSGGGTGAVAGASGSAGPRTGQGEAAVVSDTAAPAVVTVPDGLQGQEVAPNPAHVFMRSACGSGLGDKIRGGVDARDGGAGADRSTSYREPAWSSGRGANVGAPLLDIPPPQALPPAGVSRAVQQEWLAWWFVASSLGYSRQATEVLAMARIYMTNLQARFGEIIETCCRQVNCHCLYLRVILVQYIHYAYVSLRGIPPKGGAQLASQLLLFIKLLLNEAVKESQQQAELLATQTAACLQPQQRQPTSPSSQRHQQQVCRGLTVEEFWRVMAVVGCHCVHLISTASKPERAGPSIVHESLLPNFAELLRWGASVVRHSPEASAVVAPVVDGKSFSHLMGHSLLFHYEVTINRVAEGLKGGREAMRQRLAERAGFGTFTSAGTRSAGDGPQAAMPHPPSTTIIATPQPHSTLHELQHQRLQQLQPLASRGGQDVGPSFSGERMTGSGALEAARTGVDVEAEPEAGQGESGLVIGRGQQVPGKHGSGALPAWRIRSRQLYALLVRAGSHREPSDSQSEESTSDGETFDGLDDLPGIDPSGHQEHEEDPQQQQLQQRVASPGAAERVSSEEAAGAACQPSCDPQLPKPDCTEMFTSAFPDIRLEAFVQPLGPSVQTAVQPIAATASGAELAVAETGVARAAPGLSSAGTHCVHRPAAVAASATGELLPSNWGIVKAVRKAFPGNVSGGSPIVNSNVLRAARRAIFYGSHGWFEEARAAALTSTEVRHRRMAGCAADGADTESQPRHSESSSKARPTASQSGATIHQSPSVSAAAVTVLADGETATKSPALEPSTTPLSEWGCSAQGKVDLDMEGVALPDPSTVVYMDPCCLDTTGLARITSHILRGHPGLEPNHLAGTDDLDSAVSSVLLTSCGRTRWTALQPSDEDELFRRQGRLARVMAAWAALPAPRKRALYLVACRLAHGPGVLGDWWATEMVVRSLEEVVAAAEAASGEQPVGGGGIAGPGPGAGASADAGGLLEATG